MDDYKNESISFQCTDEINLYCPNCQELDEVSQLIETETEHNMYCWECCQPYCVFIYNGDCTEIRDYFKETYQNTLGRCNFEIKRAVQYKWN